MTQLKPWNILANLTATLHVELNFILLTKSSDSCLKILQIQP